MVRFHRRSVGGKGCIAPVSSHLSHWSPLARHLAGTADALRRWLTDPGAPLPASVRDEVRAAGALRERERAPEWTGEPLALSLSGAAAALGVSEDFFTEHVKPDLKVIRRGRRQLVAVSELRAWLDRAGERTFG